LALLTGEQHVVVVGPPVLCRRGLLGQRGHEVVVDASGAAMTRVAAVQSCPALK
jgi:hypothetical protein